MTPHQPTPIGVSVAQAALLTSLGEKEIREAINAGEIPATRRGVRIVVDYEGLREWIRSLPSATSKTA